MSDFCPQQVAIINASDLFFTELESKNCNLSILEEQVRIIEKNKSFLPKTGVDFATIRTKFNRLDVLKEYIIKH